MGKVVQKTKGLHQSGKIPNLFHDKMVLSMFPGKRVSKSGKIYWETRKNRSDQNKKMRL